MGSEYIWCFIDMLAKRCLLLVSDFSELLLVSRFKFLWSNDTSSRELKLVKSPSVQGWPSIFSFTYTKAHRSPRYTQNNIGCEKVLSVGCLDILGEGAAAPGMLFSLWLPWVSDHWCLWYELFCSLCTAESIWRATDPEKTWIWLKMSWANKVDKYFSVLAPFLLVTKEVVCILLYLASC